MTLLEVGREARLSASRFQAWKDLQSRASPAHQSQGIGRGVHPFGPASDEWMQQIAGENLAETAFLVPREGRRPRWFTPTI